MILSDYLLTLVLGVIAIGSGIVVLVTGVPAPAPERTVDPRIYT